MSATQIEIIDGNNALDMVGQLIDHLRTDDRTGVRVQTFTLRVIPPAGGHEVNLETHLTGVQAESGNNWWLLTGSIAGFGRINYPTWVSELKSRSFQALYDVRTRKGTLTFTGN